MADAAAPMLSQGGDVRLGAVDGNRIPRSLSAFPNAGAACSTCAASPAPTPSACPASNAATDTTAWRGVAERIQRDLGQGDTVRAHCERGARALESTWNLENFENDLAQALRDLDGAAEPQPDFDAMRVQLGPIVRGLDPATGRCLSDYVSCRLTQGAVDALAWLQGRRCEELQAGEMDRMEREFGLFASGVLTVTEDGAVAPSRRSQ